MRQTNRQSVDIVGWQVTLPGLILLGSHQISSYMHSSSTPCKLTRYCIGLDVHRDTIAACVYDSDARRPCYETEFCAQAPIKLTRFVDLVHRRLDRFRACYEASCCGYVLYKDLTARGIDCAEIAPGLFLGAVVIELKTINEMQGSWRSTLRLVC